MGERTAVHRGGGGGNIEMGGDLGKTRCKIEKKAAAGDDGSSATK